MRGQLVLWVVIACGALGCGDSDCRGDPYPPLSYADTLDEWAGPLREDGTRERCVDVDEGTCSDGKRFLARLGGFAADVRYFDDSGEVTGGGHQGDIVIDGCSGSFFGSVHCKQPTGGPLCGDATHELLLPYND